MSTKTERAERRIRAVQLRRTGADFDQIAAALGVSRTQAWRDVTGALRDTLIEEAGVLRALQAERLDALLAGVWPAALTGDTKATLAAVRVLDRQARLFGLDSPVDIALSVELRQAYASEFERLMASITVTPEEPTVWPIREDT